MHGMVDCLSRNKRVSETSSHLINFQSAVVV